MIQTATTNCILVVALLVVACASFDASQQLFIRNKHLVDKILVHPFLQQLKLGTLQKETFLYYLQQDDIYLDAYARAYLIAAAKTQNNTDYNVLYDLAGGALDEKHQTSSKHGSANAVTIKYMNLFTATAWQRDFVWTSVVLCPCMRLYAYLGRELANKVTVTIPKEYLQWIQYYNSTAFHTSTSKLESLIDKYITNEALLQQAQDLYDLAMQYEFEFFDTCYHHQQLSSNKSN